VEDLEFNRNGQWVSATGLTSPDNSFTSTNMITPNFVARSNLVASLGPATTFGNPFATTKSTVINQCRGTGLKAVKNAAGAYVTLFTSRTNSNTAIAFTCNYDTDATTTSICATGTYRAVTLVSSIGTCTPRVSDFEFANNQFVVTTNCGINFCGDFSTACTAPPAAQQGGWICEGSSGTGSAVAFTKLTAGTGVTSNTISAASPLYIGPIVFAGNSYWINVKQGYVVKAATVPTTYVAPGTANTFSIYQLLAATNFASGQVLYSVSAIEFKIQFLDAQVTSSTQNLIINAQGLLSNTGAFASSYYYRATDVVTSFSSGTTATTIAAPCPMVTVGDTAAILPFSTTAFSIYGLDQGGRFQFLTYKPGTAVTSVYSPTTLPPVVTPYLGGAITEYVHRNTRCCVSGDRFAVAQSGNSAFVAYISQLQRATATSRTIDVVVRFMSKGTDNWVAAGGKAPVALSQVTKTGTNSLATVIGFRQSDAIGDNVVIRGIAATYVKAASGQMVPFIVVSKQQKQCRDKSANPLNPATYSGQLFEYMAGICTDPFCTAVVWRILADSNQLSTGALAERYNSADDVFLASGTTAQNPQPQPDLLSLTLSPKTGMPVLTVGSTAGLPAIIECLDALCNGAQVTVADDYLAGHFGEGFVVSGASQMTLVSQAAWGYATNSKPIAQRWTSYTTSPDGALMCNDSNIGKSFNMFGRIHMCTRLARSAFVAGTQTLLDNEVRPVATSHYTWAEVGGRLRLYASDNSV
jgi:hypothetical protein